MTYVVALCIALLTAPADRCTWVEVPVESCSALGIAAQAQWAAAHPGYRIVKWRACEVGRPA